MTCAVSSALQTRQAAVQLCAEIHRWVPGLLDKTLEANLREAQIKEVAEASAAKKGGAPLVPTVYLRRDRERMAAAGPAFGGGGGGGGSGGGAAGAFDPSELVEAVDLGKALRKTEYEEFKASKVRGRCLFLVCIVVSFRDMCTCGSNG
jgi:hypothetical protein